MYSIKYGVFWHLKWRINNNETEQSETLGSFSYNEIQYHINRLILAKLRNWVIVLNYIWKILRTTWMIKGENTIIWWFTALTITAFAEDSTWEVSCSTGILLSLSAVELFLADFFRFDEDFLSFWSLVSPLSSKILLFFAAELSFFRCCWSKFCAPWIKLEWKLDSRIRTCNT